MTRIKAFDFESGTVLAGKYEVLDFIGGGYEGEVYRVKERVTGVLRAAKIFYPHRNIREKAFRHAARKLEKLRSCGIMVQYHSRETFEFSGQKVSMQLSELVDGDLLEDLIKNQSGKRFSSMEALHILHAIARGMACVHRLKEYHGDLHSRNVLVQRRGIWFDVRVLDVFNHGKSSAKLIADDVFDMTKLLHEMLGGQKQYKKQPQIVKDVCKGLQRTKVVSQFKSAEQLKLFLDSCEWA